MDKSGSYERNNLSMDRNLKQSPYIKEMMENEIGKLNRGNKNKSKTSFVSKYSVVRLILGLEFLQRVRYKGCIGQFCKWHYEIIKENT